MEFYIAGMGILDRFDLVTLTLTRWSSYENFTRISRRYTGWEKNEFLMSGLSKVIVL